MISKLGVGIPTFWNLPIVVTMDVVVIEAITKCPLSIPYVVAYLTFLG